MTPTITAPIARVRFLQKVYVGEEWKTELRPNKAAGSELALELGGGGFISATLTKGTSRKRYLFAVANVQEIEFAPEQVAPEKPEPPKTAKKS